MIPELRIQPHNWPLLLGLCLLYLLLGGCASKPKPPPLQPSDTTAAARSTVVATARRMLGVPYQLGGSTPRGFDCSGLTSYSYRNAGIAIPRTSAEQFLAARPTPPHLLQPGDLLFFNIKGRRVSHVGIYIGADQFVHAPGTGKRVSIDSLNNRYWRTRIRGSGNFFGM